MAKVTWVGVEAEILWQIGKDPTSGSFIAVCPALNLNALGDTFHETLESAQEATGLLFDDLFENHELEAFLRRNGWRLASPMPAPGSHVRFDVPFRVDRTSVPQMLATA